MEVKVKEILAETLGLNQSDIHADFKQENCAEWDSLQHLNIMVELEEVFEVSFEPEEISEMISLDKIIEVIKSKESVNA